ncbi:MAG: hypothetical protein AAF561_04085 [Planctomycetota bacterium]
MRLILAILFSMQAATSVASAELRLGVDPADGATWIEGTDAFHVFAIESDVGALLPENLPWIAGDPLSGLIVLNTDPLDPDFSDPDTIFFGITADFPSVISTTYKSFAIPGPGYVAEGGGIYLGDIVDVALFDDEADLRSDVTFSYMNFDVSGHEVFTGPAVFVPEPAVGGLGLMSLVLLSRQRRRR